jgi:predicted ArsR family transcriptional regulator
MAWKKAAPRSQQRKAVLALFETMGSITKYDAAVVIGLSSVSAGNLLNGMLQDGVIQRGPDVPGRPGSPLRTFRRKQSSYNSFLTMALRRRSNEELGITPRL